MKEFTFEAFKKDIEEWCKPDLIEELYEDESFVAIAHDKNDIYIVSAFVDDFTEGQTQKLKDDGVKEVIIPNNPEIINKISDIFNKLKNNGVEVIKGIWSKDMNKTIENLKSKGNTIIDTKINEQCSNMNDIYYKKED